LLIKTDRYPEAALFARTFFPNGIDRAVSLWRQKLSSKKHRAASFIAEPFSNPELFPEFVEGVSSGDILRSTRGGTDSARSRSVSFEAPLLPSSSEGNSDFTRSSLIPPISPYETAFSDHMSTEVNVGTGSMRADDLDDLASVTISESREDPNIPLSRGMEGLSIQEREEEHFEDSFDCPGEPIADADMYMDEPMADELVDAEPVPTEAIVTAPRPIEPAVAEPLPTEPITAEDDSYRTPQNTDDEGATENIRKDIIFDDEEGWD
jgi:hypothetical protein